MECWSRVSIDQFCDEIEKQSLSTEKFSFKNSATLLSKNDNRAIKSVDNFFSNM